MKSFLINIIFCCIIQNQSDDTIYNFSNSVALINWTIIDDGVMGGLSKGNIRLNEVNNGVFSGTVSTENNGGFSLLRHQFKLRKVTGYKSIALRVKGDKKSYQFRIKSNKQHYYSYISKFTTNGKWETIVIPLKDFVPQFRGRILDKPNFNGETIEEIAFLIGNKIEESFQLEIESITLLK